MTFGPKTGRDGSYSAGLISIGVDSTTAAGLLHGQLTELEAGAERVELVGEVLVAAVDQRDAVHGGGAGRGERGDQVREARAQIRDLKFGRVQLGRTRDHRGVHEVALAEPAR